MEARPFVRAASAGALLVCLAQAVASGTEFRTTNFVVKAPTAEFARQVGKAAEHYRDEIAMQWTGRTMPRWTRPCMVTLKVGQIGAGGATTFSFDRGEVFGWRMSIQGSEERILDSVLPHEVSHTVFACYFRRPLPRWADEGAATLVEHESEQRRQQLLLKQVWNTRRRIPLRKLLEIREYPKDMQDVMTLYAEGYSLADYLVQRGGRAKFLKFLNQAEKQNWETAIREQYGIQGVASLEKQWNGWITTGSPRLNLPEGQQLAANERQSRQPQRQPDGSVASSATPSVAAAPIVGSPERQIYDADVTIRSQSPDGPPMPQRARADSDNASDGVAGKSPTAQPTRAALTRPLYTTASRGDGPSPKPRAIKPTRRPRPQPGLLRRPVE